MQLNLTTAAEAYQSVDSADFYIQLELSSNDTNFNNTHPRLQVRLSAAGLKQSTQEFVRLCFCFHARQQLLICYVSHIAMFSSCAMSHLLNILAVLWML